MASEHGSKSPRTDNDSTLRERLMRKAGVPLVAALTAVALVACSNTGANEQPPQSEPTSISSETPGGEPTAEPTETPNGGEFVGIPSGLTVNYDHFANWDDMRSPVDGKGDSLEDDPHGHLRKPGEGKLATCYEFFTTNGLEISRHQSGQELDSNGDPLNRNPEEFLTSMLKRRNMTLALAADGSDPRNLEVAYNLAECITTADTSDEDQARNRLIEQIEGIRNGSVQLEDVTYTLASVDRADDLQTGRPFYVYTGTNEKGEKFDLTSLYKDLGIGVFRADNFYADPIE